MDIQDVKSAVQFPDVGPLLHPAGSLVEEQHAVYDYLLCLLVSSYDPLLDFTGAADFCCLTLIFTIIFRCTVVLVFTFTVNNKYPAK